MFYSPCHLVASSSKINDEDTVAIYKRERIEGDMLPVKFVILLKKEKYKLTRHGQYVFYKDS